VSKLGVIQPSTFPEGMGVQNSGVGLTQLPPGHTQIGGSAIASAGAAMIAGVPGQFHRSTKIGSNWLDDPRYGKR
jgi:hypothetical protein